MIRNLFLSFNQIAPLRLLRPAVLLGVVPFVPAPLVAQASPAALELELTRLSDEWMRAVWDKDDTVLNRLMTDDFVLLTPGSSTRKQTRPDWLSSTRLASTGECSYSNVYVQSMGDFAIMAAELSCKGDYHGIGLEANSVVSDVWVRREGRWRVASRIASTSPRFTGIWMPLMLGAAFPLLAWLFFSFRSGYRHRNSLLSSANRF